MKIFIHFKHNLNLLCHFQAKMVNMMPSTYTGFIPLYMGETVMYNMGGGDHQDQEPPCGQGQGLRPV